MSKLIHDIQHRSRNTNWDESKTDVQMYEEQRDAQNRFNFFQPNEKNLKLMEMLKHVNPAYAKHMTTKNDLINAFAFVVGGGVDLLKQPICGKCEAPATWGTYDKIERGMEMACTCSVCGHVTKNPITFEQYAMEYIKGLDEVTLEAIRPRLNEVVHLMDEEPEIKKEAIITCSR